MGIVAFSHNCFAVYVKNTVRKRDFKEGISFKNLNEMIKIDYFEMRPRANISLNTINHEKSTKN